MSLAEAPPCPADHDQRVKAPNERCVATTAAALSWCYSTVQPANVQPGMEKLKLPSQLLKLHDYLLDGGEGVHVHHTCRCSLFASRTFLWALAVEQKKEDEEVDEWLITVL